MKTEKYIKNIDIFFYQLENSMHSELFEEEYINQYDSNQDISDRKKGINPMNEKYVLKMNKKREKIGVSKLGNNGLPTDNSSELYIKKIIFDYISQKQNKGNVEIKKKINISTFFKN